LLKGIKADRKKRNLRAQKDQLSEYRAANLSLDIESDDAIEVLEKVSQMKRQRKV
jgi:hypothetical protein